jgi:hypothetical protein
LICACAGLNRRTNGTGGIDAEKLALVRRRTAHVGENIGFIYRSVGDSF